MATIRYSYDENSEKTTITLFKTSWFGFFLGEPIQDPITIEGNIATPLSTRKAAKSALEESIVHQEDRSRENLYKPSKPIYRELEENNEENNHLEKYSNMKTLLQAYIDNALKRTFYNARVSFKKIEIAKDLIIKLEEAIKTLKKSNNDKIKTQTTQNSSAFNKESSVIPGANLAHFMPETNDSNYSSTTDEEPRNDPIKEFLEKAYKLALKEEFTTQNLDYADKEKLKKIPGGNLGKIIMRCRRSYDRQFDEEIGKIFLKERQNFPPPTDFQAC